MLGVIGIDRNREIRAGPLLTESEGIVRRSTGNFPRSSRSASWASTSICRCAHIPTGMVARLGFAIATDRPGYSAPG